MRMPTPNAQQIERVRRAAAFIRRQSLTMVHRTRVGHPGGDLSAADILATLYTVVLKVDPTQPQAPERDRFIMSKGHCSASFYCALSVAGFLPREELATYMQPQSRLSGHPARTKVPGVEASTGALGHGLPIAVGAAIAAKIDSAAWRTFVLTGDGELQEGSNWEAIMAAAHYKLDNLTVIVDRNRLQQGDSTENTLRLEPLGEKWRAFGWSVREVDGHDPARLLETFAALPFEPDKPNCVIAHTSKGRGVSFMQDRVEWHHKIPSDDQLSSALEELARGAE